ncbi:uncharacterized protein LOC122660838 isoform X2 [Telopea speciosissima]|uniref:uncharacterized protein LOC122660838 isoform X2 n=1 Tax=Telopea speciosissima TaxID=54955 RepID=UPI001CC6E223|nr:uncharacterized protein LOC122660838 isoform X2 [Telopea speciosissima]
MEILQPKQGLLILSAFLFVFNLSIWTIHAQGSIPARFDGFVYENNLPDHADTILIEAFFDPVCPDSKDAWPDLKRVVEYYGPQLSLIVHPFALPRALHIVNKLNASATYPLLELFFKHQTKFYNRHTYKMCRPSVVDYIVTFVTRIVGDDSLSAVESGFSDRSTDLATGISFKYGCSRGVMGTPYFFVNGFPLPNAGSALDYNGWRSIIDPLINVKGQSGDETPHFFL